jgi:hypothetical protein
VVVEALAERSGARGVVQVVSGRPDRGVIGQHPRDAPRPLGVAGRQRREDQALLDGEVPPPLALEELAEVRDRRSHRVGVGAPQSQRGVERVLVVVGERGERRRALHRPRAVA